MKSLLNDSRRSQRPRFPHCATQNRPSLIVNANAAGRHTQIVEPLRRVDRKQLRTCAPLNLRRQIADGLSGKDRHRAFIAKAFDHGRRST